MCAKPWKGAAVETARAIEPTENRLHIKFCPPASSCDATQDPSAGRNPPPIPAGLFGWFTTQIRHTRKDRPETTDSKCSVARDGIEQPPPASSDMSDQSFTDIPLVFSKKERGLELVVRRGLLKALTTARVRQRAWAHQEPEVHLGD